jgi:glycosyltransferase involved in cell wall biosynthesis
VTDPTTGGEALDVLCRETEAALAALVQTRERTREVARTIETLRRHADNIRDSRSWQALELYRRARLRSGLSGLSGTALRAAIRRRFPRRQLPADVTRAPIGVNVSGYLDAESGMGEAARASIRSLEASGIAIALNNVPSLLRASDPSYRDAFVLTHPHPFNLVHLNSDNMPAFAARRGPAYFRNRYTIGFWFWELASLPPDWVMYSGYVDEVWAATRFVRDAVRESCNVPAVLMPLPVVLPPLPPHGRDYFGIPDGPAMFLYIFDVSSQVERKNPIGAIRAFRRAGLPRDAAVLVLKFTNGDYDRAGVRRLHEEAAGLNVVMLDGYMDRPDLCALMNAADCYFSPHRSEGFGLTILESMRLGKPAIATAYSGNTDFMTAENSYRLDFTLVPLTQRHGPYPIGAVWAEPDVDHAAGLIRDVVEHRAEAAARGARAQADVMRDYNPSATGRAVRARLEAIRAGDRWTLPLEGARQPRALPGRPSLRPSGGRKLADPSAPPGRRR